MFGLPEGFLSNISQCRALQSLSLQRISHLASTEELSQLSSLTRLDVEAASTWHLSCLTPLVFLQELQLYSHTTGHSHLAALSQLTKLALCSDKRQAETSFGMPAGQEQLWPTLKMLTQLRHLELYDEGISRDALEALEHLPGLTYLETSAASRTLCALSSGRLPHQLTALHTLVVEARSVDQQHFPVTYLHHLLHTAPNLKMLNAPDWISLVFSREYELLEQLELLGAVAQRMAGIQVLSLAGHAKHLLKLDVVDVGADAQMASSGLQTGMGAIDSRIVNSLYPLASRRIGLEIKCPAWSRSASESLCLALPNLITLDLSYVQNINKDNASEDQSNFMQPLVGLGQLRELALSHHLASAESLKALALQQGCQLTQLTHLYFGVPQGGLGLLDEDVSAWQASMPALQMLSLHCASEQHQLSVADLWCLMNAATDLKCIQVVGQLHVDCSMNGSITDVAARTAGSSQRETLQCDDACLVMWQEAMQSIQARSICVLWSCSKATGSTADAEQGCHDKDGAQLVIKLQHAQEPACYLDAIPQAWMCNSLMHVAIWRESHPV